MIEIQQVNKSYDFQGRILPALKNIHLTIQQGEIVGILGQSGAGKSTLLRCVNLLEKPDSGSVKINGMDLTTLSAAELRQARHKIGVIFQHFNLLESRTIFENVALPLEILHAPPTKIQHKVSELLELVGLSARQDYYPSQLSGGQKQRVAIARALATDPCVLLSDEATSALDSESTQSILALLQQINQTLGVTILLITHELDVVKKICDRVGIIHEGELIEQGKTLEILANPQHLITRQLVQKGLHLPSVENIYTATQIPLSGAKRLILQLIFVGKNSETPLIANIIKNYPLTLSIQQAQIEAIKEETLGLMVCELTGESAVLMEALKYIQSASVKVEVLYHE